MTSGSSPEEVWKHFRESQLVSFATNDGNQPRVRPVMVIRFEGRFFVSASTGKGYTEQVTGNPRTEFCLVLGDITRDPSKVGYVRVTCNAHEIQDENFKKKLYNQIGFLKMFNKTLADFLTNAILLELKPSAVKYMAPGTWQAKEVSL
jgi:uncharacterized pyridoxamine 5'-phosphate oxidase family protein